MGLLVQGHRIDGNGWGKEGLGEGRGRDGDVDGRVVFRTVAS